MVTDDRTSAPAADTIVVRQAEPHDAAAVRDVLLEAARWLDAHGMTLWRDDELNTEAIDRDVGSGLFWIAEATGDVAGVVKFQLTDELFWSDVPNDDSAFLHRLAVRRSYAAGRVSVSLIEWAAVHAASLGRRWLRLDCEASRTKLRAFYERQGFRHHSDHRVGPYYVSRYERPLTPPS